MPTLQLRMLLAVPVLTGLVAGCGGGGGLTQSQADDCNKVISQERAAQVVLKDLETASASAKLDDANKLNAIGSEIAKTYAKESGTIKDGMQGVGVALLGVASAALDGSDLAGPAAQVTTTEKALRTDCQIKG